MGRCCSNCGYGFSNGEAYYAIGDDELCEDCLNDCKHIFDIDEYETERDWDLERKSQIEREITDVREDDE